MSSETVEFDEFISFLPDSDGPSAFPFEVHSPGFRYELAENLRFVTPAFRVEREAEGEDPPSVVLISAPAAVGKSTVAQALAYSQRSPLWDLSKFDLGHGAFAGIPRKFYGPERFNEVEKRSRSGRFLYVLDALDEARTRQPQGYESFLEELCEEAKSPRSKASLILLGRTEASTWASLYLEASGVRFAQYSVDFFDRSRAEDFIDKYLDAVAVREGHEAYHLSQSQRKNFIEARNALFSRVFEVLGAAAGTREPWDHPTVREFLGYAPVLEVLAEFLYDRNYYRRRKQMAQLRADLYATDPSPHWKFLTQVVTGLLERERKKLIGKPFRDKVRAEADAAGWSAWASLYRHDEQCERVLRHSLRQGPPSPPEGLPPMVLQAYEETVKNSLGDHVFLKDEHDFTNVVFRDYLYAWSLKKGPVTVKGIVEDRLNANGGYRPSPLLAHFYIATDADTAPGTVESRHLGHIYESLLSQGSVSHQVIFTLEADDDGDLHAAFWFGDAGTSDLSFSVTGTSDVVVFPRFLRDADVTVLADVSLGSKGGHFDLGPAVRVECHILRTAFSDVRILTSEEDGRDVVLDAELYEPDDGVPPNQIVVKGDGKVLVSWQDVAYPWSQYRFDPGPRPIEDNRLFDALKRFASILAPFGGRGFAGLTRAKQLIDNRPVGRTPLGQALQKHLLDNGILTVDGRLYRLDKGRLKDLRINWINLMRRELSDELRDFLTTFLHQHPNL